MSLQMILGGGEDARPLVAAAHAKGMKTEVVDLPENIKVAGQTDLACYLDPLDKDAVEVMAKQLGVTAIIASPDAHASGTEAAVGMHLNLA